MKWLNFVKPMVDGILLTANHTPMKRAKGINITDTMKRWCVKSLKLVEMILALAAAGKNIKNAAEQPLKNFQFKDVEY